MLRLALKSPLLWISIAGPLSLAGAQNGSVFRLVPATEWRLIDSKVASLDAARNYGADPPIEREYGVQSIEEQTYQSDHTVADVVVERAGDASSAYGLLTFYQNESMAPTKGMALTLESPDGALMARGQFFIRVRRPSGSQISQEQFLALLSRVGGPQPPADAIANLPAALPTTGLILGTEKYVLGPEAARRVLPSFRTDLIGFSRGAEVQVADYGKRKARMTVLAITYPTPQIARLQFGLMEKLLDMGQDHRTKSIRGRRAGSFVFLALNSDSAAAANKILDQFKVSNEVSWDKPYPGDKPLSVQIIQLILANIFFILILIAFAIAGGVLIVIFRRTMAKLFPGSLWGHPDDGAIITLNLTYN